MTRDGSRPASGPKSLLAPPGDWQGTSTDPNDEQFGDVVDAAGFDEIGDYDLVIVGEPYDDAVVGRPGASGGPAAIREELAGAKTNHFGFGPVVDGTESGGRASGGASVADLGDMKLARDEGLAGDEYLPSDIAGVQDRVASVAGELHRSSATPLFLGGDNSLTVGNVRPLVEMAHEADETVCVVNFDAHLDVREPVDGPTSGTPYRQLLDGAGGTTGGAAGTADDEPADAKDDPPNADDGLDGYVVVGARSFETSTVYADYLDSVGGTVITAADLAAGVETTAYRLATATAGYDHVYVSVDLDVLDAASAPGVSAPTPGGPRTRELFDLVRSLAGDDRIAGFELVETAPSLDPASTPESPARNRTVGAAARTVAHFVAGFAARDEPTGGAVTDSDVDTETDVDTDTDTSVDADTDTSAHVDADPTTTEDDSG